MFEDASLTLRGFHYPLDRFLLKTDNPLAVSNIVESDEAEVGIEGGCVLAIIARD